MPILNGSLLGIAVARKKTDTRHGDDRHRGQPNAASSRVGKHKARQDMHKVL
jgi:hypothetical protein